MDIGCEIPMYISSIKECKDITDTLNELNVYAGRLPRSSVSLSDLPKDDILFATNTRSLNVKVNLATTKVIPFSNVQNASSQKKESAK
jgi:hypothetical protein